MDVDSLEPCFECAVHRSLQWSHVLMDVDRRLPDCSTVAETQLQWSHVLMDVDSVVGALTFDEETQRALQWSHVLMDVDRVTFRRNIASDSEGASMEPRPDGRG